MAADYYEILGVTRDASPEEIKRAYRRLARQYHPDVNADPQSEEVFKRISEAYAVLADTDKRRQYDQYGRVGDVVFPGGMPDIWELFQSAFGGNPFGSPFTARRGANVEVSVALDLHDVLEGAERQITYSRLAICEHCSGRGLEPGSGFHTCPTCHGQGQIRQTINTFLGTMTSVQECPTCGGSGQLPDQVCSQCQGQGVVRKRETRTLQIPPGFAHGDELVLRGAGDQPPGAEAGDLILRLSVKKHPLFTRRGRDLEMTHEVSYLQAILGDTLAIPTLTGETEVPLPAGTQPGDRLTVSGEGLPERGGGSRGQLIITLEVRLPEKLTEREQHFLEQLAKASGLELRPPPKGLFERIRESLGG